MGQIQLNEFGNGFFPELLSKSPSDQHLDLTLCELDHPLRLTTEFSTNSADQKGMPGYFLKWEQKKKPIIKITLSSKDLIQIWLWNQKLDAAAGEISLLMKI